MTEINSRSLKEFWAKRASSGKSLYEIICFSSDPELGALKDEIEKSHVLGLLDLDPDETEVLDLGCGVGRWTSALAPLCKSVKGVDFSPELLALARSEHEDLGHSNVELVEASVLDFDDDQDFDLVMLMGVLLHINDSDLERCVSRASAHVRDGGVLLSRESVGVEGRFEVVDEWSEALQSRYSAIYRTANTLIQAFESHGLGLRYSAPLFPDGARLNPWPETRQWVFKYERR